MSYFSHDYLKVQFNEKMKNLVGHKRPVSKYYDLVIDLTEDRVIIIQTEVR